MKLFQQLLVAGAALSIVAPMGAQASDINLNDMKSYSNSSKSEGFTNNYVKIQPGDFVHQSINDLAKSRGCSFNITDKALSRFEAAAIVNSCLGDVAEVTTVERSLIDEFSTELALIRGRIDGIEARLNEFEAGTFSSTTTLDGKAVMVIGAIDGGHEIGEGQQTTAAYVYQMNLNTSFTGDDNLYVRLKSGDGWDHFAGKPATYHIEAKDNSDQLKVDKMWYTFPVTDSVTATVGPLIENYYMLAATPSVYKPGALKAFKLGGHGAAFGASTSTGAGLKYDAGNGFAVSTTVNSKGAEGAKGFLTDEDENKVNTQVAYTSDNWHVSATYTLQSGDWEAWEYFATSDMRIDSDDEDGNANLNIDANGWALRAWWRPEETGTAVPSISVGYDTISFEDSLHPIAEDGSGFTVALNWQDMFQAEDRIGVAIGVPLKVDDHKTGVADTEVDPFIWEAYYSFRPNDSIEITPALFGGSDVLADEDDDIFGAVLTTTFKF